MRASLVSNVNVELKNALHFHMVNRRLLTKDLKNDITVLSMYNKQGLYINHYSNGVSFHTKAEQIRKKILPVPKRFPVMSEKCPRCEDRDRELCQDHPR